MSTNGSDMVVKGLVGVLGVCIALIGYFLGDVAGNVKQIASDVKGVSNDVIRLQEWREQTTTQNTVPRTEIDLRDKIMAGQMEQMRLRVERLESRQ